MMRAVPIVLAKLRRALSRSRGVLGEQGTVAVETGLTFPIFALFIYGVLEFSHYAFTTMALQDAARDGARYAMVHGAASAQPATAQGITTFVRGRLALLTANQTNVAVAYNPDNNPGSVVSVTVSYPFAPFMPGFNYIQGGNLASTSRMTISQ